MATFTISDSEVIAVIKDHLQEKYEVDLDFVEFRYDSDKWEKGDVFSGITYEIKE